MSTQAELLRKELQDAQAELEIVKETLLAEHMMIQPLDLVMARLNSLTDFLLPPAYDKTGQMQGADRLAFEVESTDALIDIINHAIEGTKVQRAEAQLKQGVPGLIIPRA